MEDNLMWSMRIRRMLAPGTVFILLVVLVVVRFGFLAEKTREGTTVGRLNDLRQSILLYYQDHNGVFPRELTATGPFGRYLPRIPPVDSLHPGNSTLSPVGNQITYGTGAPEGFSQGWYYNYENGQIFVNSVGKDSRGIPYTTY